MSNKPFVPRPKVIALLLDCLRHPETELTGDASGWKHEDGRPVAELEIAIINGAKLYEVRAAVDIGLAEAEANVADFTAALGMFDSMN